MPRGWNPQAFVMYCSTINKRGQKENGHLFLGSHDDTSNWTVSVAVPVAISGWTLILYALERPTWEELL